MARGVKGHQELQRLEKIREQEEQERLRKLHHKILTDPDEVGVVGLANINELDGILPPIGATSDGGTVGPRTVSRAGSKMSYMTGSYFGRQSEFNVRLFLFYCYLIPRPQCTASIAFLRSAIRRVNPHRHLDSQDFGRTSYHNFVVNSLTCKVVQWQAKEPNRLLTSAS
jgi:hypothetical protein